MSQTETVVHEVYFERMRLQPDKWRWYCVGCGAVGHGSEEACKIAAAGHDLDWQPAGQQTVTRNR